MKDMDALMVEMMADTVKFHPADIGGVFDVDMTNTDFIVNERQSNWDSISRDYIFIMPLNMKIQMVLGCNYSERNSLLKMVN